MDLCDVGEVVHSGGMLSFGMTVLLLLSMNMTSVGVTTTVVCPPAVDARKFRQSFHSRWPSVLRVAVFVLENSFGYLTSRNMIYEPFSYFVDFNCGPSHVFVRFSLAFLFLIVGVPICL